jgi:hypothetical protein
MTIKNITHCYPPGFEDGDDDAKTYDVIQYADGTVVIHSESTSQTLTAKEGVPQEFRSAVTLGKKLAKQAIGWR